jgi:HK97 family phage major capsid protein
MAAAAPPKAAPQLDVNQQIVALAEGNAVLTKNVTELVAVSKANQEMLEKASKPRYQNGRTPADIFNGGNAPHAREGEDVMGSRPYSFYKAMGSVRRNPFVSESEAKIEHDLSSRLGKIYSEQAGYYKSPGSLLVPMSWQFIATLDPELGAECKALTKGGPPTDPAEINYYMKKFGVEKTLSWIDESLGGSLVPPPQQMELIELLRNNAALLLAGASSISMPPNGRAIWPRQTAAAQGFWAGEGEPGVASDQATGDLILTAKKAMAFTRVNNELFRFAGINVEQFVRNDLAQVLALLFDKAGMEGVGSNKSPKGLIQYANITNFIASVTGANGNTLSPQDIYLMTAAVFGKNAKFTSWVLRPELWGLLQSKRWDTITAGDGAGGFVWGLLRAAGDDSGVERGASWHLGGYKMVQSTNVSNKRVKGSGTNLSYILGGDFPDLKIAMSGVVEIAQSTQGDQVFLNDETFIRAINYCDIAPAHEASFVWCDQLGTGPV